MARFTTNLTVTTPTETVSASKSGSFEDAIRLTQSVDNSDTPILLVTGSADKGVNSINNSKSVMIKNSGTVGAELRIAFETWAAASPDTNVLLLIILIFWVQVISYFYLTLSNVDMQIQHLLLMGKL